MLGRGFLHRESGADKSRYKERIRRWLGMAQVQSKSLLIHQIGGCPCSSFEL